jgi:glyoxylase-like metal-dependent hydrolase (beta-lactamase superfamily II)
MINSTVVVGDRGVLLVDSGGTLEAGRHIAAAVRRITPKPVTHVVNTHHHGDHYLGNGAFPGATIVSSENCRRLALETGHEWLELMRRDVGGRLPGTRPIPATLTYPEGTRRDTLVNGVRVVFWVPRGSHTAGDLMVYLPDDQVLVAGDILVNGIVPTFQDGFVKRWIHTLGEIGKLPAIQFVPGHGDVMTAADVRAMRAAMSRFYAGVKEGYRKGWSEARIRMSLELAAWEKLERAYVIGRNVNRAWLEAEREAFDE